MLQVASPAEIQNRFGEPKYRPVNSVEQKVSLYMAVIFHHLGRLKIVFCVSIFFLLLVRGYSQPVEKTIKPTKVFSYKTIGKVQIKADFYSTAGNSNLQPVIIWIHGGGLIFGSRSDIPNEQLEFYLKGGYGLVSVDYRLAPE